MTFSLMALLLCLNSQPAQSENKYVCNKTLTQFGKVEIEGEIPYDAGCIYDKMKINGKPYSYEQGMTMLAEEYVKEKDTKMLLELIDEIYLQHSRLMKEADKQFSESEKEFAEPSVEVAGSGYRITAWVYSPPSGNGHWAGYDLWEIMINASGGIKRTKVIESMTYNFLEGRFE